MVVESCTAYPIAAFLKNTLDRSQGRCHRWTELSLPTLQQLRLVSSLMKRLASLYGSSSLLFLTKVQLEGL